MKNKTALIPLLVCAPLLFMGNSPVSHVYPDYYENFEITAISFEEETEDGYPFSVTITNNGDGYLDLMNFDLSNDNDFYTFEDPAFYSMNANVLLAPHTSGTYISKFCAASPFSLEDAIGYGRAYLLDSKNSPSLEFTYSGIAFEEKRIANGGAYYYFDVQDFNVKDEGYYYYAKIVDVTIKGTKYSFLDQNNGNLITICLVDDTLTAEDFTFESIHVIQGYSTGKRESENLLMGVGVCALAILGAVAIIVSLGVFPLFILPAIIKKAKKKKEA